MSQSPSTQVTQVGPPGCAYCPDCNKMFVHPRNLAQHRRVAHEGLRYYCQDCDVSYTRQYNLTHHRLKTHPDKIPPEEAEILRKKYNIFQMMEHNLKKKKPVNSSPSTNMNNNSWNGSYQNGSISKSARKISKPKISSAHVGNSSSPTNRKMATQKLRCMMCPFSADSLDKLRVHTTKHLTQEPHSHKCKFCDFYSTNEITILQHCGTHFRWDNFREFPEDIPIAPCMRCSHCDRQFKDRNALTQHETLHYLQ